MMRGSVMPSYLCGGGTVLRGKCLLSLPVRQSTVKEALAKTYGISWDTSEVAVRHVQGRDKLGLVLLEADRPTIHDLLCC
jgi:hypothetical protein